MQAGSLFRRMWDDSITRERFEMGIRQGQAQARRGDKIDRPGQTRSTSWRERSTRARPRAGECPGRYSTGSSGKKRRRACEAAVLMKIRIAALGRYDGTESGIVDISGMSRARDNLSSGQR